MVESGDSGDLVRRDGGQRQEQRPPSPKLCDGVVRGLRAAAYLTLVLSRWLCGPVSDEEDRDVRAAFPVLDFPDGFDIDDYEDLNADADRLLSGLRMYADVKRVPVPRPLFGAPITGEERRELLREAAGMIERMAFRGGAPQGPLPVNLQNLSLFAGVFHA